MSGEGEKDSIILYLISMIFFVSLVLFWGGLLQKKKKNTRLRVWEPHKRGLREQGKEKETEDKPK